jgi:membrane-associated phospholipid phosphatase
MKPAVFISRIAEPFWTGPILTVLISLVAPVNMSRFRLFLLLFFVVFCSCLVAFFIFLQTGLISDRDVSDFKQRPLYFSVVCLSIIALLMIFYFLGEISLIWFVLKLFGLWVIFVLTSFFWKISLHTFINSLVLVLLFVYLQRLLITVEVLIGFIFFSLVWLSMIGWSRVDLKHHTALQVFSGGILPWLMVLLLI